MSNVMRAVVAEDMSFVRQLIRKYCEEDGIVVVAETGNGNQVLSLVQAYKPDLIVLDIELEDASGIEAAKAIRRIPEYKPYIIFVTGSTDPLNIMAAVNEIEAYYIVKPLQKERWDLAVHKILELFKEADHPEEPHNSMPEPAADPSPSSSGLFITLQASRKEYPIAEDSILMIEKENGKKFINIYLVNGEVLTSNATLYQINEQTSDLLFETIRGYLVNIRHVSGVTRESYPHSGAPRRFTVHFRGTSLTAPLGRAQEKQFIERLNQYIHRNTL